MKILLTLVATVACAASGCTVHDPSEPGALVRATVDEDPALPRVELEDTSLHVRTFGDPSDPAIFILSGGPGADFRYMLSLLDRAGGRALADDHFVVFHDYRGSGLSRRHPVAAISLERMRLDLDALIDHLAPNQRVVLIGHSHGGLLAAQYIGAHPERVRGAVLIEPGEFSGEILRRQPDLVDLDLFGEGIHDVAWVRQLIGARDHATADYWITIARESLDQDQRGDQGAPRSKNWRRGAAALLAIPLGEMLEYEYDYTPGLTGFERPVLFISSDQSRDLGYAFQRREQVHWFSSARHELVAGTGHAGLIEVRTKETLAHIFAYLDAIEAPR